MNDFKPIVEWHQVTREMFINDIQPLAQPAVLKSVVNNWPVVQAAKISHEHFFTYLQQQYVGGKARFLSMPNTEDGCFFYNSDFSGFNFERKVAHLDIVFELLRARVENNNTDIISMQSAPVRDYFNHFKTDNVLDLLPRSVEPRIWIGNDSIVNTHYDDSENIACVVAGKRKFTLFPPEQIRNLYIGPLANTPGGAPISMVKLHKPDMCKYPKFEHALKFALTAELAPGDAIYIPTLWWHHVESTGGVNALVNYWQGGSIDGTAKYSGLDAVLMGLISLSKLPSEHKKAWKGVFDHIVMSEKEEFNYIPESIKGVLGDLSPEMERNISSWLLQQLDNN